MNRPKFYIYLPIVYALLLILGVFIGITLNLNNNDSNRLFNENANYKKIDEILHYINDQYVDTIKANQLIDKTITSMLQHLDPHSAYITAEELAATNEPLQGNFEGIGVEFNIVSDTIRVVTAIAGGPAEKLGVEAGDKIIKIDEKPVAGTKITNKEVMEKLKGAGGTKVKISILRKGKPMPRNFTITRGVIPIYSVDASYMVTPKTGYIKISRFAATTFNEYIRAFERLQNQGMQKLIIDLRGNGGGYLNTAVSIADEFLSEGKEIVYTIGKSHPRKDYKATSKGGFENGKLMVLIDGGSASASEILAGALQDNDRAVVVGRRSFGKGLVQEQSEFKDGSAIRLTIARYYTPTGRCIQKSYKNSIEEYYQDQYDRLDNGELYHPDTTLFVDSLKFKTPKGKTVYGGGGIMPDIFVPFDSSGMSLYYSELRYSSAFQSFAFDYVSDKRTKWKSAEQFNSSFKITDDLLSKFTLYAEKQEKVKQDLNGLKMSKRLILQTLKAEIARQLWEEQGYFIIINSHDSEVQKAIKVLNN